MYRWPSIFDNWVLGCINTIALQLCMHACWLLWRHLPSHFHYMPSLCVGHYGWVSELGKWICFLRNILKEIGTPITDLLKLLTCHCIGQCRLMSWISLRLKQNFSGLNACENQIAHQFVRPNFENVDIFLWVAPFIVLLTSFLGC